MRISIIIYKKLLTNCVPQSNVKKIKYIKADKTDGKNTYNKKSLTILTNKSTVIFRTWDMHLYFKKGMG